MKVCYAVFAFLVLFPSEFLARKGFPGKGYPGKGYPGKGKGKGKGKPKPTASIIPIDSCYECIVVNAPTCLRICLEDKEGKECFICLSINAPQCLKPCFPNELGQIESPSFGDEQPAPKKDCQTPQPTCPPSLGLRIISMFSRHAPTPTPDRCEVWCSRDPECEAWTFDQRLSVCYLYDYSVCYSTVWERNWISGVPCRFLKSEYDSMDTTANSTASCIQIGIDYPGNDLITYRPELSAADCGRRCQKLGTVVQAWSWATAETKNPLRRFTCFCKTTQGNPAINPYINSGEIDCPPVPKN